MLNWNEMNENEIIESAKNGDDEAKMLIINRYKPLVYRFLSQYYSRFASCSSSLREDLIDEGVITILECINSYDSSKASFSTHCYYQLRATIQNGLRPTVKSLQHGTKSLDQEMNDGNSDDKAISLYDVVADNNVDIEKDYIENEERDHVWEVAKRVCTSKEYATLKAMATDGLTRKEMAELVGVTESALCGLRNRSFSKIRKNL